MRSTLFFFTNNNWTGYFFTFFFHSLFSSLPLYLWSASAYFPLIFFHEGIPSQPCCSNCRLNLTAQEIKYKNLETSQSNKRLICANELNFLSCISFTKHYCHSSFTCGHDFPISCIIKLSVNVKKNPIVEIQIAIN